MSELYHKNNVWSPISIKNFPMQLRINALYSRATFKELSKERGAS